MVQVALATQDRRNGQAEHRTRPSTTEEHHSRNVSRGCLMQVKNTALPSSSHHFVSSKGRRIRTSFSSLISELGGTMQHDNRVLPKYAINLMSPHTCPLTYHARATTSDRSHLHAESGVIVGQGTSDNEYSTYVAWLTYSPPFGNTSSE